MPHIQGVIDRVWPLSAP